MSVVVRMEMPYSCTECRFNVDGWCYAISEYEKQPSEVHYLTRPEWCPIICQLPEGHGRLVDADMLKQKWLYRGNDGKPYRDEIDSMPTIVPVEAERSET